MKRLSLLLVLCLLVALTGCSTSPQSAQSSDQAPPKLVYYTIGGADEDLKTVENELNKLLLDRYGFTVSYNKIGWNDYISQINGLINTNQHFDVCFTWGEHYLSKSASGAFMNLGPYLSSSQGKTLYQTVDPLFWQGVTIDDQIYGVPTNKELATPLQLLFSQELVEKYDFDVSGPLTLEALEPMLKTIAQLEPDCIPLFLSSDPINLMELEGYEYLTSNKCPLVIRSDDPNAEIVNLYETPEARRLLRLLHRYYKAGYINSDAALRTGFSRFEDEKVFCRISTGGPDSSESFSVDYGYPIIAVQVSEAIVNNVSTQGGIMAISAKTRYPREAQMFLTAVNTDPDVRNLLNFGIEGIHYHLNENSQAEMLSTAYRGVPYSQGNWFILHTMAGEHPDKWELYRSFNREAHSSRLLGFVPDLQTSRDIYTNICLLSEQYQTALTTGSVNPDIYLPKLNRALRDAGIYELIQILQPQVDAWMARNK